MSLDRRCADRRDGARRVQGLSNTALAAHSVEPAAPIGVDLGAYELALTFPDASTWPVTGRPAGFPTAARGLSTSERITSVRSGISCSTRGDAHIGGFRIGTPEGRRLRALAGPLDIPPLERSPPDHVLTRTF